MIYSNKTDLINLDQGQRVKSAVQIDRMVRALNPWPGVWTILPKNLIPQLAGRRLKILKARLETDKLVLEKVQLEGKKPTSWKNIVIK